MTKSAPPLIIELEDGDDFLIAKIETQKGIIVFPDTQISLIDTDYDIPHGVLDIALVFERGEREFRLPLLQRLEIRHLPQFAVSSGFMELATVEGAIKSAMLQTLARFGTLHIDSQLDPDFDGVNVALTCLGYQCAEKASRQNLKDFLDIKL